MRLEVPLHNFVIFASYTIKMSSIYRRTFDNEALKNCRVIDLRSDTLVRSLRQKIKFDKKFMILTLILSLSGGI